MEKFTIDDLPKLKEVVSITEDKSLREALQLLIKYSIYSMPVYSTNGDLVGMLPLENIISVLVKLFADKSESKSSLSTRIAHHKYTNKEIIEITQQFNEMNIKDSNVVSECTIVDTKTTLFQAIHLILDKKSRLVVGSNKHISNIISPFLFVKFLSTHKDLPVFSHKLLDSKAKITVPVTSINANLTTISAFAKMVEGGFSGVAVIEEDRIITALTFKDISFALNDFTHLIETTEEYVKLCRQSRIETTTYPTINVSETDSLNVVVQKFVAVKAHRVFVRRGETIYGIVSVSDLLYAFI